jgi:hypothetical protein
LNYHKHQQVMSWMAPTGVDPTPERTTCAMMLYKQFLAEVIMKQPTVVGLDLAKQVFQVHGIDADGTVVVRKKFRRSDVIAFFNKLESWLIGIEACGTAHYWGTRCG